MKSEKIKIEDILRLNSNIALINAIFIAKINNKDENIKIKENNFEEHLILNKEMLNKISKFNKEINKNNKKEQNENNQNQQIDVNEIKKNICFYLRNLRNFYSHHPDEKLKNEIKENNHLKAKKWLDTYEKKFQEEFLKIFKFTYYFSYFASLKEIDWRIYIISLFLTNLEFKEMIENINKYEIKINKYIFKSPIRNLRFKFNFYKFQEPIEIKLLNYIKTFNEIKNYKKSFANQAINLLNWKYKNEKIEFNKEISKGKFLFSLRFIEDEIIFLFNFSQLRRILFIDKKSFISIINKFKNKFKNQKIIGEYNQNQQEIKSNALFLNFKSFQNRFKTQKIDIRHILKILNKVLKIKYNLLINQKHFEDLYKDLYFENTSKNNVLILKSNDENIKKIIEVLKIKKENYIDILSKIKDFIYKEVSSENKFNEIFINKINKSPKGNIISQNKKLMFLNVEKTLRENVKEQFDHYVLNSLNLKDKKLRSNFRKFLLPLIIFYKENIENKENSLDINQILDKDDYVIENQLIIEIFKNKISKNKDHKVFFTFDKNQSKLIIKNELIKISNREIISSKLFFEFSKLLKISKILTKEDWSEIIKKLNWYKEKEFFLIKQIYNKHNKWMGEIKEKKYRNYIFHRSISKFENFKKFSEYVENKIEKKSTPYFLNKKQ